MSLESEYKKFKWFFTSSGKLVVAGKSALQNDSLLLEIKKSKTDFIVMHTSAPGSPFSVILSDEKKLTKSDLEECAVFTGCFSRAWRSGKKKASVHIFKSSQLSKSRGLKVGTWKVSGNIRKENVELLLVLTKQKGVLRAVPEKSGKKSQILLKIVPGKIDKRLMLPKLQVELTEDFSEEEMLSALPAGGLKIKK